MLGMKLYWLKKYNNNNKLEKVELKTLPLALFAFYLLVLFYPHNSSEFKSVTANLPWCKWKQF